MGSEAAAAPATVCSERFLVMPLAYPAGKVRKRDDLQARRPAGETINVFGRGVPQRAFAASLQAASAAMDASSMEVQ